MKNTCAICGNKVEKTKLTMTDGYICPKCMVKSGWGHYMTTPLNAFSWAKNHSVEDFKELTSKGGNKDDAARSWAMKRSEKLSQKIEAEEQQKQEVTSKPQELDLNDEMAKKEAEKIKGWDISDNIKEQLIKTKAIDLFGVKKELRYLPNILGENEPIKYVCSGLVNNKTWLVVCTNSRVIFLNKNMFIGMQQQEIPLEYVNAVSYSQGVALGTISVTNGANTTVIDNVGRVSAPIMAKTIKDTARAIRNGNQGESGSGIDDSLSTLKKLKELADSGVITQDEFETKKKEILDKI